MPKGLYKTENLSDFKPSRFTSSGTVHTRKGDIPYHTVSEDNIFYNKEGKAIASVFSYSYFRSDVEDASGRPVIFGFNGGPGSSSMMVHTGFLGTKRLKYFDDPDQPSTLPPYEAVDNIDCLIDTADIVVVDPVGTGYGLLLDDEYADQFFTIDNDAEALLTFISGWLTRYDRWLSPKYLVGESYGCIRSAVAAGIATGGGSKRSYSMAFDGIVFIGNSVTTGRYFNQDIPCELTVISMPTVAAINWYHNHPSSQSLEEFVYEAREFAESDYMTALFRGNSLDPEQYRSVLDKLKYYTGMSEEYLTEHRLRWDEEGVVKEITRKKGYDVSRYDGRMTLPHFSTQMGHNYTTVKDDPSVKYSSYFHSVFRGYVCPMLNIKLEPDFLSSAGFSYDYFIRETKDRLPGEQLSSAMRRVPGMRVFFANGWYDICTQIGMVWYLANHAWLPEDRTFIKAYPSGHMLYIGEENIEELNNDIRKFLQGQDPSKQ